MKVASFFTGIGGFDLGFERAGMEIVFQCEINAFNQKILGKHWSDIPLHQDIKTLSACKIPESQVWCGGFPCQDVSLANNGKREGLNGQRSGLFYKFRDLVARENLAGLFSKMFRDSSVASMGKISKPLSSRWMNSGMVWRGEYWTQNFSEHPNVVAVCSLSQAMDPSVPLRYFLTTSELQSLLKRAKDKGRILPTDMESAINNQLSMLSKMRELEESILLARKGQDTEAMEKVGRLIREAKPMLFVRRLTPLEYEKLQTFPSDWTLIATEVLATQ